jgi:membrane dipeptidase
MQRRGLASATGSVAAIGIADLEQAARHGSGTEVEVRGWIAPFRTEAAARYFALVEEAPCCIGCLPREPARRLEVFARMPVPITGARVRLKGHLVRLADGDEAGWRFQLRDAQLVVMPEEEDASGGNFTRRRVLHAATLACIAAGALPACVQTTGPVPSSGAADARKALQDMVTVDVHSHAGGVIGVRRVESHAAFTPVADPMREGGMAVLCLAIVSDAPTHHVVMPEHRIRPFRDPAPGELYAYGQQSFMRVHELIRQQQLLLVTRADDLAHARAQRPAIVVSAEGGDFLEGQPDRVEEAFARWQMRHLQLTHYRVNELGDIQTEPPVHGGLTAVGAEVVRRCNSLGVVVDVAHGTYDLVKQAAAVARKPLVLSHTSLAAHPGPHSRQITPEHARVIAGTGGLVGIWPPASIFPDMASLAGGMARMADVVGIDHVALGTDMRGLVGPSTFDSYRDLPALAEALLDHGFQTAEVQKILGGNYLRVFSECMVGS